MSISHFLFVTGPSRGTIGHSIPFVALAARLVQEQPGIIVTFPVLGEYGRLMEGQLEKYFPEDNLHLKGNVRFINLGGEGLAVYPLIAHLAQHFELFYSSIFDEKDIKCATGRVYAALPKPRAALLDFFLYNLFLDIRKVSQNQVPVLAWNTTSSAYTMYYYGPKKYGGRGDISEKAVVLSEQNGTPFEQTEGELYISYSLQGNVVKLPGYPSLYDYEIVQRDDLSLKRIDGFTLTLLKTSYRFLRECDGMVSSSNEIYDHELNAAFREWFSERNKAIYFIGPLLPPDMPQSSSISHKKDLEISSNGKDIELFLDKILESHGEKSLLYVAFGSYFWPKGDTIWKIFEVMVELKIPIILSYSRNEEMPAHIKTLFESYDKVLISKWAPQQSILAHRVSKILNSLSLCSNLNEATGWFMTHCGQNSTAEAISYGVPMIAWGLLGDQPINAVNVRLNHDVAYQLLEVRTGSGLKPLYRGVEPQGSIESAVEEFRHVWAKAQGEDGARKRSNVQQLKEKYKFLWEEGGSSLKDYKKFLQDYLKN
ncbi:hypothetical protein Clacol_009928 [Clathrus columnatus]|uniref:Uncharacterized protein n=1 Tax=Clathrus columnatus TaxID=1419009 RepID=A0AAV5ASC9_9AGAM|nr:hypothetical protein Clacol_009928 [Clathrus columnatus]